MKISKGEQKIIYKKEGGIFNCYHIKVINQDNRHILAIDLNDKQIEKTFNVTRVMEVIDKLESDQSIQIKLSQHILDYRNRELPSSFVHGSYFSRAKGYLDSEGDLVLKLQGSIDTKERDVKIFMLLIYYFKKSGKLSAGVCKRFIKKTVCDLLGYRSDDQYNIYDFTADGKRDLIDLLKDSLSSDKGYLKDLITTCKEDGDNPNEDQEIIALTEEIDLAQNYLKVVRTDYRQELIKFLCREYYYKHEDSIFYDIAADFPIN